MNHQPIKIALVGNPNTGKTSIFNALTGLNQRVGNYPGITVEKKMGEFKLSQIQKARIYDLPGVYSISPHSLDEKVAIECLLDRSSIDFPDVVLVVCDVQNLKQNLILYSQIKDLKIPTILVLNMADKMQKNGISVDISALEKQLKTKIALVSSRDKNSLENLKNLLLNYQKLSTENTINIENIDKVYFEELKAKFPTQDIYKLWLVISQNYENVENLKRKDVENQGFVKSESEIKRLQQKETILRYQFINSSLKENYKIDTETATGLRFKLDRILTHKFWGYVIFGLILLTIFQLIYNISGYPMGWIDEGFNLLSEYINQKFPEGPLTELFSEGIVKGIGGIVVFIPQIALLFLIISVLEESGYMSRVVFLMDRIMRPFGLSGKSVIPFVSGVACAIPAVMATRNIESTKERLIAVLTTPFIACSARLPIYLIIIELIIPEGHFLFFNYKGLALLSLYFAGFFMAIFSAFLLNQLIKKKSGVTPFIIEMPNYQMPLIQNVLTTVFEKTKSFVWGAGKIILAISVVIWFLQTHGFSDNYKNAEAISEILSVENNWTEEETQNFLASYKTENSLLGNIGKTFEPIFSPIGYDWKISIAVLCSFAARETFVSTLAVIYSLGEEVDIENPEEQKTIISQMKAEIRPDGTAVFSLATGVSILIFYAFAMQCISTLAIVKKETNSWKWAVIQFVAMTSLAYLLAFIFYNILS